MASNDDKKVYPGQLARYTELRELRAAAEKNSPEELYLTIAEELAGLSYIMDGIRYNTRGGR